MVNWNKKRKFRQVSYVFSEPFSYFRPDHECIRHNTFRYQALGGAGGWVHISEDGNGLSQRGSTETTYPGQSFRGQAKIE